MSVDNIIGGGSGTTMTIPAPVEPTSSFPSTPTPNTTAASVSSAPTLEIVFSKTLSLEIPRSEPSSSTTSSEASSPVVEGIQDSSANTSATAASSTSLNNFTSTSTSTSTTTHTSTNPNTPLNVKFAPLPELAPRKRRSSVPLGMAARAQLVRRRRGYQQQQQHQQNQGRNYHSQDPDPGPQYREAANPMWTEEELAEARARQVQVAMEKEKKRREAAEAGLDPNDPFVVFAAKVKDKSKQIWKKVSKKDMKGDKENVVVSGRGSSGEDGKMSGEGGAAAGGLGADGATFLGENGAVKHWNLGGDASGPSSTSSAPANAAPLRSILISTYCPPVESRLVDEPEEQEEEEEEEGGVWEEEIDRDFPLNASQSDALLDSSQPSQSKRRSLWADQPPLLDLQLPPDVSDLQSSSPEDCPTPTNGLDVTAEPMTAVPQLPLLLSTPTLTSVTS